MVSLQSLANHVDHWLDGCLCNRYNARWNFKTHRWGLEGGERNSTYPRLWGGRIIVYLHFIQLPGQQRLIWQWVWPRAIERFYACHHSWWWIDVYDAYEQSCTDASINTVIIYVHKVMIWGKYIYYYGFNFDHQGLSCRSSLYAAIVMGTVGIVGSIP